VVCALPFSVLRKIDGIKKLGLSKLKERSINEFSYGTNAKFMSSYKERVWRNKGSSSIPPSQAAVITDLEGGQYWETSRIQSGKSGIITNFLGGLQGAKVTESHMNTILSDLNTLWPGLASLHDGKSVLKAWTREKYAMGSYSSPGPGQYTSFIGVEGEPELNNKLLFIGEHTSPDWIGYMNGAIQTGNDAALMISGEKLSNLTDRGHGRLSVSSTREARRWKSQNVW
jgi:monoamine oxidase